eukprot:TRINITY_DN105980_c0_g1_i1.p1 TRINITY_DN105980_c0_g1~~TRINITY_DN105980_c0_g1_i1.p1  ORF type:complete len:530 (+),score=69.31 TRINITY_DN105980_c0_g1_i1:116-1591(+)
MWDVRGLAASTSPLLTDDRFHKCQVPVRIITMPSRETHAIKLQGQLANHFRDVRVVPAWNTTVLAPADCSDLVRHGVLDPRFCAIIEQDPAHGRGAIGCALSHTSVWLDLMQSSSDWMVVLEDDVNVDAEMLLWEVEAQQQGQQEEADYVVLGCNLYLTAGYSGHEPPFRGSATNWQRVPEVNGMQGYMISKEGARRAAKFVWKEHKTAWHDLETSIGLFNHIDFLISQASVDGVLTIAFANPPCVSHLEELRSRSTRTGDFPEGMVSVKQIRSLVTETRRLAWEHKDLQVELSKEELQLLDVKENWGKPINFSVVKRLPKIFNAAYKAALKCKDKAAHNAAYKAAAVSRGAALKCIVIAACHGKMWGVAGVKSDCACEQYDFLYKASSPDEYNDWRHSISRGDLQLGSRSELEILAASAASAVQMCLNDEEDSDARLTGLYRLESLWEVAVISLQSRWAWDSVEKLLQDDDAWVRSQAARVKEIYSFGHY